MTPHFVLTIICENAAFDGDATREIAAILERVRTQLQYRSHQGSRRSDAEHPVLDSNGNTVGSWKYVS